MNSNTPAMLPLQLIFIFGFILLPLLVSAGLVAKPGCPDRCGNLSIPYPFGIGPGCSLDTSFNISCNTSSTGPLKAYITIIDKEVIEINETYVRVRYPNYMASSCYGSSDKSYNMAVSLSGTPYTLSSENWLTVLGCDDTVVGRDGSGEAGSSCASLCAETSDEGGNGYCPGDGLRSQFGCCRAPINAGSTFLRAQLSDLSRALLRPRLFPCSYAFIQESGNQSGFSYRLDFLQNSSKALPNDEFTPPLIVKLEWRIGNTNCSELLLSDPSYACKDRSICTDIYSSAGYVCSCFQGYKGNPYLVGGCEAFSAPVAKSGCLDHCLNMSIPFPFGVGPNCYKDPSFDVTCNLSSNPPKAHLSVLNAEILDLNLTQIRVDYPKLALACYNLSDDLRGKHKTESRSLIIDLKKTPFLLSTQNVLVGAGCDELTVAYGGSNRSFVSGSCIAFCADSSTAGDYGRCAAFYTFDDGYQYYDPGFACCQAPISKGTSYLEVYLSDLSGQWRRKKLFPCSYAIVREKDPYSNIYPLENLHNSTAPYLYHSSDTIPLVLDWRIGVDSCKQAQTNLTTFACQDNSVCVDFDANVGGYLCNCLEGYEGNPYLKPGCQVDIDECADDKTSQCHPNSACFNTRGSYLCVCRKGYFGDGRKGSTGCTLGRQLKLKMIIFAGMGSALGLLLLLFMFFWLYKMSTRRKERQIKEKFFNRNGGLLLKQQTDEGSLGKTNVFSAKELEVATDHFSESRVLGQGGQGTVYKGMLSDGKIVAVKKSKKLVEENQLQQFINEVVILSQINHRNVVRLLGCCLETEVPLLVYEFMPNGTLFELIHDSDNEFPFPWSTRLKIAADIAGAIAYLHYACSMPIYHRDIKSSNVLLDEKYVVKVSDFGTSRSVAMEQTHLTTMVKGTFGYLDPEYFQSSQFTEKSDVYSFGVVLVELLTRLKPISTDRTEVERALATRFLTCMEENCLHTILDPQVSEQGIEEEVALLAKLAQRCLNMKGKMRPTMKEVANELDSLRLSQMSMTGKDEYEDVKAFENIPLTISDIEYTWTGSYKSAGASPSSDMHPLMSQQTKHM